MNFILAEKVANGVVVVDAVEKAGRVTSIQGQTGALIRTPPDQMSVAIFEALGASAAPLGFSELATALQSGVFDGQENLLSNICFAKIEKTTKFITLTGHQYQTTPVAAGQRLL